MNITVPTRYLDLDSTYRCRVKDPHVSDFTVTSRNPLGSERVTALTAVDPVSDAYPECWFQGNVVAATGIFIGIGMRTDLTPNTNNYIGAVMEAYGVKRIIVSYDKNHSVFGLNVPLPSVPAAGDPFTIIDPSTAGKIYIQRGNLSHDVCVNYDYLTDQTSNESRLIVAFDRENRFLTLDSPFTMWSVGDRYAVVRSPVSTFATGQMIGTNKVMVSGLEDPVGKFFSVTTPGPLYDIARIVTDYSDDTLTLNETLPFSGPVTIDFRLYPFTKDNYTPLSNSSSVIESGLYSVTLDVLIIPNTFIENRKGFTANLPYLYVEFGNTPLRAAGHTITNNPHGSRALFKCIVYDTSPPNSNKFVKLSSSMSQMIQFDPTGNVGLKITLPDGTPFRTVQPDTVPPKYPNPDLQVSVTISLRRAAMKNRV